MEEIFFELRGEIDTEWTFADEIYLRAHQHACGARGGGDQDFPRSELINDSVGPVYNLL